MAKNTDTVGKVTPKTPGFYWLTPVGQQNPTPAEVSVQGEELVVSMIGLPGVLRIGHFPEGCWGDIIRPK